MTTFAGFFGKTASGNDVALNSPIPEVVVCDSRKVSPGALFVAIRGVSRDGHECIAQALALGAKFILCEKVPENIPREVCIVVPDSRAAYSALIRSKYGDPDDFVSVLGVTGTNGKTSSAFILRHLISCCGKKCGLVSTVVQDDGKVIVPADSTTPDAEKTFALLDRMRQNQVDFCAMEFSSHSLSQRRNYALKCAGAIFTNLTGDHLDYHHDMASYFAAKKELFQNYLRDGAVQVVNIDDPKGAELFAGLSGAKVSFGEAPGAMWHIKILSATLTETKFSLASEAENVEISIPLGGIHNVRNYTGALLLLKYLGFPWEKLVAAAAERVVIPGRLECYRLQNGATAFVDYAHTDDALKNVLTLLRKMAKGRIIAVFGAGGNRDKSKRPRMGKVVSDYADIAVVTSDNPRNEEPMSIIEDILSGMPERERVLVEPERRRAIELAVSKSQASDIILIAGKGHETTQEIAGVFHHFSDAEVIRSFTAQK